MKMGNSSKFTLLAVLIFVLAILSAVNFGNTGDVRDVAGQGKSGIEKSNNGKGNNNGGGNNGTNNNANNGNGGNGNFDDDDGVFDDGVSTYELCGYAWGGVDEGGSTAADGGVGWVSFNSKNTGNSGPSYSVYAEEDPNSSRVARLKGYAWSDTLGWIKFGDLQEDGSGFNKIGNDGSTNCSGSNFPDCGNARIVYQNPIDFRSGNFSTSGLSAGQDSEFRGWLRVCSGTASGDCSSPQSRTDGWGGWVSLDWDGVSGGGGPSGFTGQTSTNVGYAVGHAWGSDVFGWLSLGPPSTPGGLGDTVYFCDGGTSFNFSVSGGSISLPPGGSGSVNVVVSLISGSSAPVSLSKTDPSEITSLFVSGSPGCTPPASGSCAPQVLNISVDPDVAEGVYYIRVNGTSGSGPGAIVRNVDIPVTVTSSIPSGGTLNVSCPTPSVPNTDDGPVVGSNRFYVNRPVTWTVNVNSPPDPTPPLSYKPIYGGVDGQEVTGIQATSYDFTRTYTTIGVKRFSAEVTDSLGAVGTCDSEQVIVVVNPDFNEK